MFSSIFLMHYLNKRLPRLLSVGPIIRPNRKLLFSNSMEKKL